MRRPLAVAVLLSGCASTMQTPVSVDRVPEQIPEGVREAGFLTVSEVTALSRVSEDAKRLLWPVEDGGVICQYTPQALMVTLFSPDGSGRRYVTVAYNPESCPIPETYPILHRHLAYVLAPGGELLGPRFIGR